MMPAQPMEVQLAEFRRTTEVGLVRVQGGIDLLVQRAEQSDRTITRLADEVQRIDERVDAVERNSVTREDMERRSTRNTAVIGVVVGVVSIISSAGTSVLIAVLKG